MKGKHCPRCKRAYTDETLVYCLTDGALLLDSHDIPTEVYAPYDAQADAPTEILPEATLPIAPAVEATANKALLPGVNIAKALSIGILALLVIVGLVAGIKYFALRTDSNNSNDTANTATDATTPPSFTPYPGNLKNLFPESVGKYQRSPYIRPEQPRARLKDKESASTTYKLGDKNIYMRVYNFPSEARAREALLSLKSEEVTQRVLKLIQDTPRTIDDISIGDRVVLSDADSSNPNGRATHEIIWTHGSVVFSAMSYSISLEDLLDFEYNFPY